MKSMTTHETWAKRFAAVSVFNMILGTIWVAVPLLVDQRISRTIAGGSVGTWGYVGFFGFAIVGVLGFVAFATLYYMLPKLTGGTISSALAAGHLVLLEIGTVVATGMLSYAGYLGGITLLEGGTVQEVHEKIAWAVEPPPGPIAIFIGIAGLGALFGIINLVMAFREKG